MEHIEEVAYNALSFVWNVNEEAKVSAEGSGWDGTGPPGSSYSGVEAFLHLD